MWYYMPLLFTYLMRPLCGHSNTYLPISPTCINNAVIVTTRENEHEGLAIWHTRKLLLRPGLQQQGFNIQKTHQVQGCSSGDSWGQNPTCSIQDDLALYQ